MNSTNNLKYDIKQYISLCKTCDYNKISDIMTVMKGGYNKNEIIYYYKIVVSMILAV